MKTFEEFIRTEDEDYQALNKEVSNAAYKDIQKTLVKLVESDLTSPPDLSPVFEVNEKQVHDKVSETVSRLIEKMIRDGNNDYREIVKILENTINLVSLLNQFDVQILAPKFKKNVDLTSKIMGMTPEEYNVTINKELNTYRAAIDSQCYALNKLLDNKIDLKN